MNAHGSLGTIENRLRRIIRRSLRGDWRTSFTPRQLENMEKARQAEMNARVGAITSDEPLDFTSVCQLGKIIVDNWDDFEPIFKDRTQFDAAMRMTIVVRNTIAHNRPTLPYEDNLLAGVAGWIGNVLSLYVDAELNADADYPRIETLIDGLGRNLLPEPSVPQERDLGRFNVGDYLELTATSTPKRGRALRWFIYNQYPLIRTTLIPLAEGEGETFRARIALREPGESWELWVLLATDSKWHRHKSMDGIAHDDLRRLSFSVRPPHGE